MSCPDSPNATFTYPALDVQERLIAEAQVTVTESWGRDKTITPIDCAGDVVLEYSAGSASGSYASSVDRDAENVPLVILVGTKDEMTFGELLSSGVWVLDLHSRLNRVGWTFPVFLLIFAVVIGGALKLADMYGSDAKLSSAVGMYRMVLYVGALVGFSAAALEGIVNLGIAQMELPRVESEFGEAFAMVFLPNVLAIAIILAIMYVENKWVSSLVWAPLEFVTAFSFLAFFYAGLYVGPSFWMAAALVRLYHLVGGDSNSLYA